MSDYEAAKRIVDHLLGAKAQRRAELARLPFKEKVDIVLRLQEVARKARKARWPALDRGRGDLR